MKIKSELFITFYLDSYLQYNTQKHKVTAFKYFYLLGIYNSYSVLLTLIRAS